MDSKSSHNNDEYDLSELGQQNPRLVLPSAGCAEQQQMEQTGLKESARPTDDQTKGTRFTVLTTSILCAFCLLTNSMLSFFLVEKKRLWTQGHVLSPRCDLAELGFLLSFFFSISGSFLACTTTDWIWFIPSCVTLALSSLLYLSVDEGCEDY